MRSNPFMPVGPYQQREDASKSLSEHIGAGAGLLKPVAQTVATSIGGPLAGLAVGGFADYLKDKLREDEDDDRQEAARIALGLS